MVVVPTDQFVLIGVGLLDNAVVNRDDTFCALHRSHRRFDDLPPVCRLQLLAVEHPTDLVVADRLVLNADMPVAVVAEKELSR